MSGIRLGGGRTAPLTADTLYAARGGSATTSDLYTLNPATAVPTSIGAIGFALTGLASRPSDGALFGVTSNNSAANPRSLISIDRSTGAGTLIGALGLGSDSIGDIAFRSDDVLYGHNVVGRRLHTINTSTGVATQVSATAVPGSNFGYGNAFDSADVLYLFSKGDNGVFYIVDETTGGVTAQPALTGSPDANSYSIPAASCDPDDLVWITISNALVSPTDSWLATVDVSTSVITVIALIGHLMDGLEWGVA